MPLTLKQNLDQVLGERGFPPPAAYVTSANPADIQMLYIANRAASAIREAGHQRLVKQHSVSMTAATSYDLPADFLAYVADTAYVDGRLDPVDLPTSPGTWALLQAGGPSTFWLRCRFMEGELHVLNPIDGETLQFEYISNAPIQTTGGGALKSRFDADSDVWLLDDDLLQLEIRWRWEEAKGVGTWQATAAQARQHAIAVRGRDSGAKTLVPSGDVGYPPEPYTNLWRS